MPLHVAMFNLHIDDKLVGSSYVKTKVRLRIMGLRASLVAQWLRILLPVPGTRVRALVREDPTCHRATKPVSHNY